MAQRGAGLVVALLLATLPRLTEAATLAGWSQYGEGGHPEARIVTDAAHCPVLKADGRSLPMHERTLPSAAFPARVCVAVIPAASRRLSAGGLRLPAPVARPRHLLLLGDTGCRLKGDIVQACNDPAAWPFPLLAQHAAAEHPDLVIHVGDYLYRESACKEGDPRCSGTPWGDNWPTWAADFFSPASPLLAQAVWVTARGNHEDCRRAGIGWSVLLGRDVGGARCTAHEQPLLVDLGGMTLAVVDDNDAADGEASPALVVTLRLDITLVTAAKADWLVTHHPFRGVARPPRANAGAAVPGGNATLDAAIAGLDEHGLSLLLAGHIHNLQIENFADGLAPQLVVGEGGDNLDKDVPADLKGLISGGQLITDGFSLPGFGYVVADRRGQGQDWDLTVHAADGAVLRRCQLAARHLACPS
jgi:hypothetical protein